MNESILRSIENGTFIIRESKKRTEEIFIRIRLESGQIIRVNKNKDDSKRNLKEDESVITELSHITDVRNSDGESLFHKKHDRQSNYKKIGVKKIERNMGFRFTIHCGLLFDSKILSFRALNTSQYFDWITGLRFLVDETKIMTYESLVECWLWKQYYEIGESVTEERIKGPVEIDDEFITPISFTKQNSSSLTSLNDFGKRNKEKYSNHTPKSFRHFRRFSWGSMSLSMPKFGSQLRFASQDSSSSTSKSIKSFDVKISSKQLKVWLAQQNGTKISLDNIKDYHSNYPPKPNFIDFCGFSKIYKELLVQHESFVKIIDLRLRKIQNKLAKSPVQKSYVNKSHLNTMDSDWLQSIMDYSLKYDICELDLDSLFNPSNSLWNSDRGSTVYQDMDQPLSAYFISTSHNSYLTGDQITSKSSCDAYTRCIQLGCRSVELDCWNGDREPIIYHGNTLTSKIKLDDTLQTIRKCAWQKSIYPLILSIEDHCDIHQQTIIAQMVQEIFQDELLTNEIKMENASSNQLPSPNQLQKKIILKHKRLPIDNASKSGSMHGLNELFEDSNETRSANYLYSGRMFMKDLILDSWSPYYFLISQGRTLVYMEDTSSNETENQLQQISYLRPSAQRQNKNFDVETVDNSARFITIDHGEKLAIDCNGCVPSELTNKMKLPNWFYGSLSRCEASNWLLRYWFLGDGTFLIRNSESFHGNYSLSFYRKDKIHHVRICRFFDRFRQKTFVGFEHCDIQFMTMDDLVQYYQENEMIALDFKIRLKHPPPERFHDKAWFYSEPFVDKSSAYDILDKIPLAGCFLVYYRRSAHSPVDFGDKMSPGQRRLVTDEQFFLCYRGRCNAIVHMPVCYDGFQFTILGQSSISLTELIEFFSLNRLPDGVRLKYPADSDLIRKCDMLSKTTQPHLCNSDFDKATHQPSCELTKTTDISICPSATANDLLSLRQNQEDQRFLFNGHMPADLSHHMERKESNSFKFQDIENEDLINLGSLGNMGIGSFQLDSDCSVKLVSTSTHTDIPFMFPFDLFIVDFKIHLACETENQRSCWIEAINNCLQYSGDQDNHLMHRRKEIEHKIAKPLSDLIIYCSTVPFNWPDNPKDFGRLLDSPCRDMSSMSENRFIKLISLKSNPSSPDSNTGCCVGYILENSGNEVSFSKLRDLTDYHKNHLTRVYPKATRLDSSNLSPIIPWLSGTQMVALNFQTWDRSFQLNQALFRDNGGCGYVLKNIPILASTQSLEVHLSFLGARHLPRVTKGVLEVEIISLGDDIYEKKSFPIKGEFRVTDLDIPDIYFSVKDLNLAMLRFVFGSEDQLNQKKKINACQSTFLIRGMRPGIRSVTLRNGLDYIQDLATLLFHANLTIVDETNNQ